MVEALGGLDGDLGDLEFGALGDLIGAIGGLVGAVGGLVGALGGLVWVLEGMVGALGMKAQMKFLPILQDFMPKRSLL